MSQGDARLTCNIVRLVTASPAKVTVPWRASEHTVRQFASAFGALREPVARKTIARFIDGRADVRAHGPRDMPVWGKRLNPGAQGSERLTQDLIAKLVTYLQSIRLDRAAHQEINSYC